MSKSMSLMSFVVGL